MVAKSNAGLLFSWLFRLALSSALLIFAVVDAIATVPTAADLEKSDPALARTRLVGGLESCCFWACTTSFAGGLLGSKGPGVLAFSLNARSPACGGGLRLADSAGDMLSMKNSNLASTATVVAETRAEFRYND